MADVDVVKLGGPATHWRFETLKPGDHIPEKYTLPPQAGNAGLFLQTNGTITSWVPIVIPASFITSVADTPSIDLTVALGVLTADLTLTGVVAGVYGDATNIPQITVDAQGRITSLVNVPIVIPPAYILSVSATDTVNLTVDGFGDLTADVITQLSITSDASGIKLVNDSLAPGNSFYYGTDAGGVKGFFTLPTLVNYIVSVSDTNTVDLNVDGFSDLTANVRYQDTNTVDLADDASGLKATVKYQNSTTINLSADASGLKADLTSVDGIGWALLGNNGTDGGTLNFLGTIDNVALQFRSFNTQVGYLKKGTDVVFFGTSAGSSHTGTLSIGIGIDALSGDGAVGTIGIGARAMQNNIVSLDYNIGIGYQAGQTQSGSNVILIGKDAGKINTFNDTIAIGKSTVIKGVESIAIGHSSIASTYSTIIGQGSSDGSAPNGSNTIIGSASSSTRDASTIVGRSSNSTGGEDIILGNGNTASGGSNIVMGYSQTSSVAGEFKMGHTNAYNTWMTINGVAALRTATFFNDSADFPGTLIADSQFSLKSSYWNVSKLYTSFNILHAIDSSGPTSHAGFLFGTVERMRLTSTGDLGIGTASPVARTHIKGSGFTSATETFLVQNSTPTNILRIRDDGLFSLGLGASAFNNTVVAVGAGAAAGAASTIAIGLNASAGSSEAIVIGANSNDNTKGGILIGANSTFAVAFENISIGGSNNVSGAHNTVIAFGTNVVSDGAIVLGYNVDTAYGSSTFDINSFNVGSSNTSGMWLTFDGPGLTRTLTLWNPSADSSNQLASTDLNFSSSYWNGAVKVDTEFHIIHKVDTTAPTSHAGFLFGASEKMRLTSAGLLGIGTITPTEELHVVGSIRMVDTTEGFNKYLVDDGSGNGVATWATIPTPSVGTVTNVTATAPLTSSGGATPDISTSMNTNKLIGRSTAGVGVMEEITVGSGLTLSAGTLTNTATPTPLGYYGSFSDVTDQTAAVINTGYPMLLGVTDLTNGVTVVSNSRITIANTGIYNIQWSGQITNPTASNHDVTIWLRKNGVDVAGSSGVVTVPAKHGSFNGHILPAWNYLIDPIAGDYYEFVWSTENKDVYLSFTGAGSPPPSAASVIVTVTQQSGIMAGTGITAINTLTGAAQTLTVGTTGIDFAIVDSGVDHKFNLPTASASNRGALSAADWTTFNNKGSGTVTSVATAGLLSGGIITTSGTITTSVNTNKLIGRGTVGVGVMEEITLGTGLSLSGTTLNVTVVSGYNIITVNFAASPYTVLPTSGTTIYVVDCTAGNVVLNFPTAVANTATYGVKKIDASANTITLTPNGAETIDGAATQTIRFRWTEIDIFSDNSNLLIK